MHVTLKFVIHRFDKESGLLFPSVAEFKRAPSALTAIILKVLSGLGFIRVATNKETGLLETTNLTILNVFLVRFGPMREDTLVKVLISSQVRIARSLAVAGNLTTVGVGCWQRVCVCCAVWYGVASLRR